MIMKFKGYMLGSRSGAEFGPWQRSSVKFTSWSMSGYRSRFCFWSRRESRSVCRSEAGSSVEFKAGVFVLSYSRYWSFKEHKLI